MRLERVVLPIILLSSLMLRCLWLQDRGIAYDDAFSVFLAEQDLAGIVKGTAADTMPPLYYFLLHYWMKPGSQLYQMRLLGVVLSLGSVLVLCHLITVLFGKRAGFWAALFAGISPLQIYHAQELRMYSLLGLCLLGYALFFYRIWKKGAGWRDWAGFVICAVLAMYTHNLAVFTLIVPNFFLLVRRELRLFKKIMIAQLVIGLLFIPWLLLLPGQIAKIQEAFWTPRPGLVEVFQAMIITTSNLPLPDYFLPVAAILALQVVVLISVELRRLQGQKDEVVFLLSFILIPPLLLFLASYLMRPVFVTRGFLLSTLAYAGLAGYVTSASWRQGAGKLIAGGLLIAGLIPLPYQYTYSQFPRSPFRAAAVYLTDVAQDDERIVHDNKLSYFPTRFYARNLPQWFIQDEPGSHNDTFAPASQEAMSLFPVSDIQAAVSDNRRVYFVVFSRAIEEYKSSGYAGHPNLIWLEDHFELIDRQNFNDLEIYRFDR